VRQGAGADHSQAVELTYVIEFYGSGHCMDVLMRKSKSQKVEESKSL
jgi:hypothetical protein